MEIENGKEAENGSNSDASGNWSYLSCDPKLGEQLKQVPGTTPETFVQK